MSYSHAGVLDLMLSTVNIYKRYSLPDRREGGGWCRRILMFQVDHISSKGALKRGFCIQMFGGLSLGGAASRNIYYCGLIVPA